MVKNRNVVETGESPHIGLIWILSKPLVHPLNDASLDCVLTISKISRASPACQTLFYLTHAYFLCKKGNSNLIVKTLLWCCILNAKPFFISLTHIFYAEKETPNLNVKTLLWCCNLKAKPLFYLTHAYFLCRKGNSKP